MNRFGVYVHVPFCAAKCAYCDFHSAVCGIEVMRAYAQRLTSELENFDGGPAATVYFGGGTPTVLPPDVLVGLLSRIKRTPDAEVTIEANPGTVDLRGLKTLRTAGFNRVSFGMQTHDDALLTLMGRVHSHADTMQAVTEAKKAGFENISLDLMYGLPGQTPEGFMRSLEAALSLSPKHISLYALKLEENTPFYERYASGGLPDEDTQAGEYLAACEALARAGFEHYEISNFALPGFRSQHNSDCWALRDYMGFGPGAHSLWKGRRFYYARDTLGYIRDPRGVLTPEDFDERAERIMLALRTVKGISAKDFPAACAALEKYEKYGLTRKTPKGCALTERGFLLSNRLIAEAV